MALCRAARLACGGLPNLHGRLKSGGKPLILLGDSTPHPGAVESLDVVKHIGPGLVSGTLMLAVCPLVLEHAEEPLACCIVTTVTDSTHGAYERIPM